MTTRDSITRYRRKVTGFYLGAMACGITGWILLEEADGSAVLGPIRAWLGHAVLFAGIAMFAAHFVFLFVGSRCLQCCKRLRWIRKGPPWRTPAKMRYCPFCGTSIDIESPAESAPKE